MDDFDLGPLIDHHCHGLVLDDLDRPAFEALMNEGAAPSPLGTTFFDSMLGLAVRQWCAPVLGLEPHALAEDYLIRRRQLGTERALSEEELPGTGVRRDLLYLHTGDYTRLDIMKAVGVRAASRVVSPRCRASSPSARRTEARAPRARRQTVWGESGQSRARCRRGPRVTPPARGGA